MSPRNDKLKHSIREVLDSPADLVVMTLLVLFSVFAWDVSRGWLSARVDVIIEGIMTGLFVVFVVEIVLMIYVTPSWWREFSIWLFVFAMAMMAFEIPWIQSSIFGASYQYRRTCEPQIDQSVSNPGSSRSASPNH